MTRPEGGREAGIAPWATSATSLPLLGPERGTRYLLAPTDGIWTHGMRKLPFFLLQMLLFHASPSAAASRLDPWKC